MLVPDFVDEALVNEENGLVVGGLVNVKLQDGQKLHGELVGNPVGKHVAGKLAGKLAEKHVDGPD